MSTIILIDTSYIFHRVTACEIWCKKAEKKFDDEAVYNNFISSITKLSKRMKTETKNMILCRDSRNIWRKKIYTQYKSTRKYSNYGPYIKELYRRIEKMFNIVLRIDEAEADDIIGILSFYYIKKNIKNHVYIISNDSDFFQLPKLMNTTRIHILNNANFKEYDCSRFNIEDKIYKGDICDNVKKLKKKFSHLDYLQNKQLIDLSYSPRFIQDKIFSTGYFSLNQNIKPLPIQLGFACINTALREKNIFCSRTVRLKTIEEKGIEYVKDLVRQNIKDLALHVQWNYENGIRIMRMSSEMLPHYGNPKAPKYNMRFITKELQNIGNIARLYKQRLTFHPGQFNVLSTESEKVFQNTKEELKWHADLMDVMGLDQNSIIVIHGGGLYGNKETAIERFISNFKRLDENVKRRLVLENCENSYNIEDVLYISDIINIPIIFDTHHYSCYNIKKSVKMKKAKDYIPLILNTWIRRNIKPKFHISEQKPDARIGAHSDYVQCIPDYLLEIKEKYGIDIDIMIEAKMKEKSVFKLYELYPELSPY